MLKKVFMCFVALLTIAAAATGPARAQNSNVSWVLTPYGDLQDGDMVVIVDKTSARAMANNNGSGSAPSAVEVSLSGDQNALTAAPAATLQWVVVIDNGDYMFQVPGTDNYLYCTSANNGVRVGTNGANQFTFEDNLGNYTVPFLKNIGQSRYLGVYNTNNDWRCYTTVNSNITNTVISFYKKTTSAGGGSTPEPPALAVTHTVTLADTVDPANWQGKVGDGEYQALPLEGVAAGTAVTVKYNGTQKVKSVKAVKVVAPVAPVAGPQTLTVDKGSTGLSGNKELYYMPGDTYRQALARPENQSGNGLGWGSWEDGSLATIFFKEVSNTAWDMTIDGQYNFAPGVGAITLDSVIDPNHTFLFTASH